MLKNSFSQSKFNPLTEHHPLVLKRITLPIPPLNSNAASNANSTSLKQDNPTTPLPIESSFHGCIFTTTPRILCPEKELLLPGLSNNTSSSPRSYTQQEKGPCFNNWPQPDIMEGGWSHEQRTLISELVQGMDMAKQLRLHMASPASAETRDVLIQGILSSYKKALLILKWSVPIAGQCAHTSSASGIPESPLSVNGSPHIVDFEKGTHEQFQNGVLSKKRKMQPKWTDRVRVNPETGLEGPHDDGYSWRKYGQKDILGARYARSYYRCTYRNTQNCWATKQVQRDDEDPTVFEITYKGTHTCAPAAPVSPENQDRKETNQNNTNRQQQQLPEEALSILKSGLTVNTDNSDNNDIVYQSSLASLPPMKSQIHETSGYVNISRTIAEESFLHSFLPPSTPEYNYFSMFQRQVNEFSKVNMVQHSKSDRTDIISANTSSTNSPILDLEFSLDQVGIDPHFPFDTTFFS